MPLFIIILFLLFVAAIWITVSLVGLLVTLVVAGLIGWAAAKIIPGRLPYGWLGAVVAGLVGSWLGGALLGDVGPSLGGIAIVPGLVGAIIVVFTLDSVSGSRRSRERGW